MLNQSKPVLFYFVYYELYHLIYLDVSFLSLFSHNFDTLDFLILIHPAKLQSYKTFFTQIINLLCYLYFKKTTMNTL